MPCVFNIRLNPNYKINGWEDCLYAVALEIQQLNEILTFNGYPAITVHPESTQIENFLGSGNTIPTEDERPEYAGIVTVAIQEYDFIDHSLIPANPSTFFWISGTPPQSGRFI